MYSDTHFHFKNFVESGINGKDVLIKMAERNCFFGLDIGTKANDLQERQECVDMAIATVPDSNLAERIRNFIYFSAGIWPSVEAIKNRVSAIQTLKESIKISAASDTDTLNRKIIALGECGIDHHWNPSGIDKRDENCFNKDIFIGERELFEMQLELARELNLPVIIHSRDSFEDTLDCIKNIGWHKGIIHCYSYGKNEAKSFLDLGWYISLSGSVTYTKKSKMQLMEELILAIPDDRLLCETDSPYLAPVPFRGQINTPVLVEHVYDFTAKIRKISAQNLSEIVDNNIKALFNLTE